MYNEYYISAVRITTNRKGIEYVSHVRAHAKVGDIIKEVGQTFDKNLVITMMSKAEFYSAIRKDKKSQWTPLSRVTIHEGDDEYYLASEPHDLEELPVF